MINVCSWCKSLDQHLPSVVHIRQSVSVSHRPLTHLAARQDDARSSVTSSGEKNVTTLAALLSRPCLPENSPGCRSKFRPVRPSETRFFKSHSSFLPSLVPLPLPHPLKELLPPLCGRVRVSRRRHHLLRAAVWIHLRSLPLFRQVSAAPKSSNSVT